MQVIWSIRFPNQFFSRILSQIFYIKPGDTAAIILDTLDLVTVTDRGSI